MDSQPVVAASFRAAPRPAPPPSTPTPEPTRRLGLWPRKTPRRERMAAARGLDGRSLRGDPGGKRSSQSVAEKPWGGAGDRDHSAPAVPHGKNVSQGPLSEPPRSGSSVSRFSGWAE